MGLSLSQKQKILIDFARQNDNKITKKQAVDLIGACYYYNEGKYVGEILSRLVNNKCLKRLKPGNFELLTTVPGNRGAVTNDENQQTLF